MLDVVLSVVLAGLLLLMIYGVRSGRWSGTWAGSGRTPEGRRLPGGPLHPSSSAGRGGTFGRDRR
jgi:hypothetical protein